MAKYDPNKDYSALLSNPNLSAAEREQYTQERQAKIADMYGGKEPTLANSTQTFSSQYGASGATPTTYFNVADPQTQQTGYIINGMTYSDPYGYNRVGTGSVVNTGAGRYIKTDSGSMRYDDYLTELNNQLQQENQKLQTQQKTQQITMDDVRALIDSYSSPVYTPSPWDETREKLAQAALAMNYDDWTNSDQYRALAARYGHQGQLTMQDVLGQVASRTGGLASSWAQTAAQQQYNEYMARLEEAARSAYNTERSDAIQNAQLAYDFADSDYGRYLDQLAQSNNDRNFAFDVLSRALEQSNYANEWANTLEQQRLANQRYEDETAYNREQDSYNRALQQAQTLAMAGDFSGFRDLGYTDAQIESLKQSYAADQLAAAGYRGTSGGGDGDSRSGNGELDYEGLFRAAMSSGNPKSWLAQKANYSKYGFTTSSGLWDDYQRWAEDASAVQDMAAQQQATIAGQDVNVTPITPSLNTVMRDIQELKTSSTGATDTQINNVISSALASGIITSTEAAALRRSFIGSR